MTALTIGGLVTRNARHRPDHVGVIASGHRLTHHDFNLRVNRLANGLLAAGVQRGQRIATLLPNCLELLDIYWAAAKIGAVAVPLSPMLLAPGLASLLDDAEAVMLFTTDALLGLAQQARKLEPRLEQCRLVLADAPPGHAMAYAALLAGDGEPTLPLPVDPADVYNIMYTSGTTGQPKGIVLSQRVRATYALLCSSVFRIGPESVVLATGSLVFNGAFVTLMAAFFAGATYIVHPQFDAEALIDTVRRERVTHIMLVPSQIIAMLASPRFAPEHLGSLQMILSLGAPLHAHHKDELQRVLPGRFHELYGLTEGFLTILDKTNAARKAGSVGCAPPFMEMRIVREDGSTAAAGEVGEIVGRGPMLMDGYFKRPDLTAAALVNGWLHTGDLGYADDDGFLFLVDRKKDMIDSGGVKVYPRDIEELLAAHPAVLEVAVFGIPHERWGETPLAAVVLRQPGAVDGAELKEWLNSRVSARFQRVHDVVVLDAFPRNAAGKVLKRDLREPYWEGSGTRI
ncbi:MAG: class I adenylate-forming enzyme family protein [Telluria sp.]